MPSADDFLIAIFDTNPSFAAPGSLVASFDVGNGVNRLDSGFDDQRDSRDIYNYSASIDFTANAGQRYWVSMINSTPTGVQYFQGNVAGDPAGYPAGNSWRRFGLSGGIDFTEDRLDFRLMGTAMPDLLVGDVNLDGVVTFLDISPFIATLSSGGFQAEADIDQNGVVNFLDIAPFIDILANQ